VVSADEINPVGWGVVEQDPAGLWWITTDDSTTVGPFLDEVQATRHHTWPADLTGVVVHTTTTSPQEA